MSLGPEAVQPKKDQGDHARRALRDFYKIQQAEADVTIDTQHELSLNDLDSPDVNAHEYVTTLLASGSLSELAKTAASLEHEIKTLDSEQKSLVYNNYKKLIRASETLSYIAGTGPLDGLEALVPQFDEIATRMAQPRNEPSPIDFAAKFDAFTEKYGDRSK